MRSKYFRYLLFSFILYSSTSVGQILNIDREGNDDSTFKKYFFVGSFSLSSDKQKNNVLNFSSSIEAGRNFKNNYSLIGIGKNDAIFNGNATIQNEGQLQLRYRDLDKRKASIESYVQYQWNGAWGMEYRSLLGANLRLKFLEKKKSDLYLGLGLFREWERWNWSGVKNQSIPDNTAVITSAIFRFNTYAKYSIKLSDRVDVSAISYLQFPLYGNIYDPRWYFESNLYIVAGKHLNFLIHWDHIYDDRRLVPIDNFYYTFSTGIQFNY
jgi:hypothetical protein